MLMLPTLFNWHNDVIKCKHFPRYRPFVTGEFPSQRPVTRGFGVFFDLLLNKRLSKQLWWRSLEISSCVLWRHCNENCQQWLFVPPESWMKDWKSNFQANMSTCRLAYFFVKLPSSDFHSTPGNGLVPSGNRAVPAPMLTQCYGKSCLILYGHLYCHDNRAMSCLSYGFIAKTVIVFSTVACIQPKRHRNKCTCYFVFASVNDMIGKQSNSRDVS